MLSRKQLWRKTRSNSIVRTRDDIITRDSVLDNSESKNNGNSAEKLDINEKPAIPRKLRSALNLANLLSDSDKAKRPKDPRCMRFSSTVHICLIPSRHELSSLVLELFWKSEDYVTFKSDAVGELRTYLTANGITAKEAIFRLYQPHEEERRQWMKEMHREYESSHIEKGEKESETDRESSSHNSVSTNADDDVFEGLAYNSDDDDEPTYGDDMEGLNRFSGLKTDIELNAHGKQRAGSITKMPTKTPSGASGADNQHVWAVTWKPKAP